MKVVNILLRLLGEVQAVDVHKQRNQLYSNPYYCVAQMSLVGVYYHGRRRRQLEFLVVNSGFVQPQYFPVEMIQIARLDLDNHDNYRKPNSEIDDLGSPDEYFFQSTLDVLQHDHPNLLKNSLEAVAM